jgi:uncharacterized protein
MFRHIKIVIAVIVAGLLCTTGLTWAQSVKERMHERLPEIVDLKTRGIVGENNQGYLEFRSGAREKENLVNAENKDRRTVYEGIAKKTGTTADLVGQRRALQIAEVAESGQWLQDQNGTWYQK